MVVEAGRRGRREGEITLSGLRTFVAVAEAMSFQKAAGYLGVSQPTVSVQLQALEQACGVLLFNRKPELALTAAGRDLFVRARLAVSRVDEFGAVVRDLQTMQRGQLTVGLSTPHTALPIIAAFMAAYPSIAMATSIGNTAQLLDQIARCQIDIGIMTLVEQPQQFACRLIETPRLMIIMPREHRLADRTSLSPADLASEEFLLREEGSMTRAVLEAAFVDAGIALRRRLVLGSRETIKVAVAARMGLGAVFENEFNAHTDGVAIPLVPQPLGHGVYAVTLKESVDIPVVTAFVEKCGTLAGRRPG